MDKRNIKVICFGTFDFFHPGHLFYLKEAKKYGNYLIVVVANDKTVKRVKGKKPYFNQEERSQLIKSLRIVDKVIKAKEAKSSEEMFKVLKLEKPQIIALGYDQKVDERKLKEWLKKNGIKSKIVRIKPYKKKRMKSSIIKKVLEDY
ncbi:MAG: adenylyltransferase/cytidyltransferase family protein [Candidatus Micrarchaeia archaeon]